MGLGREPKGKLKNMAVNGHKCSFVKGHAFLDDKLKLYHDLLLSLTLTEVNKYYSSSGFILFLIFLPCSFPEIEPSTGRVNFALGFPPLPCG